MEIVITEEMKAALDLIQNTNSTVYITGKAGTGKTTFLKHIVKNIQKQCVVTASTGVAAINAGGVTLHSLLNIPFGPIDPGRTVTSSVSRGKYDILTSMEVLIIDEISMVRPDVLDFINQRLQTCRGNSLPFGGVQVVMFGDLFQLPPVVKDSERKILLQFYEGVYFFHSKTLMESGFSVVELNHIFRQSDQRFIDLLNSIREYKVSDSDLEELEALRSKSISADFDSKYIHICTHKAEVRHINKTKLGEPTHTFYTGIEGDAKPESAPCDNKLMLRVGARVMTLVNDRHLRYCNGSLGNVTAITDQCVTVRLDNGLSVGVERYKWATYEYKMQNGTVTAEEKGSYTQFPVTLAWAITIHKSQGLTFEKVAIHIQGIFCPGQIYVALSRCRTMEGIVSDSFIDKRHIIPDRELIRFEQAYRNSEYRFDGEIYQKTR
jgi:hypothetical protein